MTYQRELDDLRTEIRTDVGGTIRYWPKADGENVQATSGATYQLRNPDGTLRSAGVVNPTDVGVPAISYYDIPVSAALPLDEDYTVRIAWTRTSDSSTHLDVRTFDVVHSPYPGTVSLNDLREERPDIDVILARIGSRLGLTPGSEAEEAAAVFASRARVELDALVRNAATEIGSIRPRLILDRARLNRVERKLACMLVFASIAKDPNEGEDESSALYRFYRDAADAAWRSMGPIKVDASEDLVPDTEVSPGASVVFTTRVQGRSIGSAPSYTSTGGS